MALRGLTAPASGAVLTTAFLAQVLATAQNADDAVFTGFTRQSVLTDLTATGNGQFTALPVTTQVSAFSVVPAGTGALLPSADVYNVAIAGAVLVIFNQDPTNALNVYPPLGGAIGAQSLNVPVSLAAGAVLVLIALSATLYEVQPTGGGGSLDLSPSSLAGNPTGASGAAVSVPLAARLEFVGGTLDVSSAVALTNQTLPAAVISGETYAVTGVVSFGGVGGSVGQVVAAGTSQATAPPITAQDVVVVSGTGGVLLVLFEEGVECVIRNRTTATVDVYPPLGAQVETAGVNQPVQLLPGTTGRYSPHSPTQWYF